MTINFTYHYPPKRPKQKRKWMLFASSFFVVAIGFGMVIWHKGATGPERVTPQVEKQVKMAELRRKRAIRTRLIALAESQVVQVARAAEGPDIQKVPPPPPSMETIKKKGCIADGVLSGYGEDTDRSIDLINRSECQYLHRAIETWLAPPDFRRAKAYKDQITKPNMIYGMFIAEAIDRRALLYYPDERRYFDFSKMCRTGSKNDWGEHTCKPSFEKKEYRKYLRYISQQAIDMGVQSFMFGQIFYQERSDLNKALAPEIINEMRLYAASQGMQIVVGAQTNDIIDSTYLGNFDYIEGGVGINSNGEVEDGACFSRWWKKPGDWCWALLWHDTYTKKANDVLLHLDWSGKRGDDMSIFALMDETTRAKTLDHLYKKFTNQGHGFLMPILAPLPKDNGGCYGPKERYYSPDKGYSCNDEDAINTILNGGKRRVAPPAASQPPATPSPAAGDKEPDPVDPGVPNLNINE